MHLSSPACQIQMFCHCPLCLLEKHKIKQKKMSGSISDVKSSTSVYDFEWQVGICLKPSLIRSKITLIMCVRLALQRMTSSLGTNILFPLKSAAAEVYRKCLYKCDGVPDHSNKHMEVFITLPEEVLDWMMQISFKLTHFQLWLSTGCKRLMMMVLENVWTDWRHTFYQN